MAEGSKIEEQLASGKRLTSGLLVSNRHYMLNEMVRDAVEKRASEKQDKEQAKIQKDSEELSKRIQGIRLV